MIVGFLALVLSATPARPADTAVICPADFKPALQPWLDYRAGQGHIFAHVSNTQSPDEIRADIREVAKSGALRYVVIVGDDDPAATQSELLRTRCTPSYRHPAQVNVRWGSEPEIATDNWYADLNDDRSPDVAIGRLTADNPAELSRIVKKILEYERATGRDIWRRRINLVAGVGGFGVLVDGLLESLTKRFLTEGIPAGYVTSMTYASWQSPYCPDPRRFRETAVERLTEGCLLWVYLGHGQPYGLDHVQVPGATFPILSGPDVVDLPRSGGAPIALMLACYTGAFDAPADCLAEEMLRADAGPVAILSGSRVTMPYAMAVLSQEMMTELFERRTATVGEVLLNAKRRSLASGDATTSRRLLDGLARIFTPSELLEAERAEHAALFNLIGDPLLRIRHPHEIPLQTSPEATAGEELEISGTLPIAGQCTLELVCRRDSSTTPPIARGPFEMSDGFLSAFDQTYRQANEQRWYAATFSAEAGEFKTKITVPDEAQGPCHIRIFTEGGTAHALGSADVLVRPALQTAE